MTESIRPAKGSPAGTNGRRLRGVIFDMDGVLVASEPFTAEASMRLFAEKGYTVGREEFRPFVGMGEERFLGGVAERRGIPFDPVADVARMYQIYLEIIPGRLQPLNGATQFVAECAARGLALAVASSAHAIKVEGNLAALGLPASRFDAVVTGCQVARKKPAPDIFQEAARRLGLEPGCCLVVEDAIAGVEAAKAAGCRCLAVTTCFTPEQLAAADWVAPDLAGVPDAVLAW